MSTKLLSTTILEDTREFAALEEEWEELYRHCPAATPFQSWAWLYSWWEHYGEGYELRIVAVRSGELLVGILPLMIQRRTGFAKLLLLGDHSTAYKDVLVRQGWESEVAEAGILALGKIGPWQMADLQELRPEAAAWSLLKGWDGPQTRVWKNNYLAIEVRPWDELLMALTKNLRKTARRTINRAEEDGVRWELVGVEHAEEAARRLVALHREMWRAREIDPEHLTERFQSHMVAAARRMTSRALGGISECHQNGEVLVSHFWVSGREFLGIHMIGASQRALQQYQLSSLYIWDAFNIARSKNSPYVSLMQGEEAYKLRWKPRVIPNRRMILGRSRVFYMPYAGWRILYSRVRKYKVELFNPPRWMKRAARKYRILRSSIRILLDWSRIVSYKDRSAEKKG